MIGSFAASPNFEDITMSRTANDNSRFGFETLEGRLCQSADVLAAAVMEPMETESLAQVERTAESGNDGWIEVNSFQWGVGRGITSPPTVDGQLNETGNDLTAEG